MTESTVMLRNLLARIHGDGGHYTDRHGLAKSVEGADMLVAAWRAGMPARWLCYAWGETDYPHAELVSTRAEVVIFLCNNWFCSPVREMDSKALKEFNEVMAMFDAPDWDGDNELSFAFEIGGVKIVRLRE